MGEPPRQKPNTAVQRLELPPVEVFLTLPTFGKWLPISCRDVVALQPYHELYSEPCPERLVISGSGGPYFFLNHPINYVLLTGKCVEREFRYYEDSKTYHYMYTIDDDTGATVTARQILHSSDDHAVQGLKGQYVEVRGYVASPVVGRAVYIRSIRRLNSVEVEGRLLSPFQRFLLASEEVLLVRRHLLCAMWRPKMKFRACINAQADPVVYCSFSRMPSCFHDDALFRESVTDEEQVAETQTDSMGDESQQGGRKIQISNSICVRIPKGGGIQIRAPSTQRKRVREESEEFYQQRLKQLKVQSRNAKQSDLLKVDTLPPDSQFEVSNESLQCSPPSASPMINPLIRNIIEVLKGEPHHDLSIYNPKPALARKPSHTLSSRAMAHMLKSTLPTWKRCTASFDNFAEWAKELDRLEEEQPFSEFVSVFTDLCGSCLRHGLYKVRELVQEVEPVMEQAFYQFVVNSVDPNNYNIQYDSDMARYASNAMVLSRVKKLGRDPCLADKLVDLDSEVYAPVPRETRQNFVINGLHEMAKRGELVRQGSWYVRPTPRLLEPFIRKWLGRTKQYKTFKLDDLSPYLAPEFAGAKRELLAIAVRQVADDMGRTVHLIY